jgi:hypothetical protein
MSNQPVRETIFVYVSVSSAVDDHPSKSLLILSCFISSAIEVIGSPASPLPMVPLSNGFS